ncbi:MAG: TlpA disulfide reductase family protein [Bacteroidota bacterium]
MKRLGLILLICAVGLACGKEKTTEINAETIIDIKTLEQIDLVTADNNPIHWRAYEDKVVFLNLWATWCGPCIKEMPSIENATNHFKNDDIVFILATEENASKIREFGNRYKFNLDFVQQKTSLAELGIVALPTTLVFDKSGKLVFKETNARQWDSEENLKMLSSFLLL